MYGKALEILTSVANMLQKYAQSAHHSATKTKHFLWKVLCVCWEAAQNSKKNNLPNRETLSLFRWGRGSHPNGNNINNSSNSTTSAKIAAIVVAILDNWMSPRELLFLTIVGCLQCGVAFFELVFCHFLFHLKLHIFPKMIQKWRQNDIKMTPNRRLVDV